MLETIHIWETESEDKARHCLSFSNILFSKTPPEDITKAKKGGLTGRPLSTAGRARTFLRAW
jgi:hypothetical protein